MYKNTNRFIQDIKELQKKKKKPLSESQVFEKVKSVSPIKKKLLIHSLKHGGMTSPHMKKMVKYIKEGLSFNKAHLKASK